MDWNVVYCEAIDGFCVFWKRMDPSLMECNAIECGGFLWNGVEFCQINWSVVKCDALLGV